MKKFLKLFFMTAILSLAMCAGVYAETETLSEINESRVLTDGDILSECTIKGGNAENPIVITINEGTAVRTKAQRGKDGITIANGSYVRITGSGTLYNKNDVVAETNTSNSSDAMIKVEKDATLTLDNITLDGNHGNYSSGADLVSVNLFYGINNEGTLNINEGTHIKRITTQNTSFPLASAVANQGGTVNMSGGEITGFSVSRGGAAMMNYKAGGKINFTGGLIYDNQGVAINNMYGSDDSVNIEGGLMLGAISGKYAGIYSCGPIASDSADFIGTTIKDATSNIEIPFYKSSTTKYLGAVSSHTIVSMVNDEECTGIFQNGQWHFVPTEGHKHEMTLEPDNLILSLAEGGIKSSVIEAEIVCPNHKNVMDWKIAENQPTDIVSIKTLSNNPNAINVTALKAGTTKIEAVTADKSKAQCTVTVEPDDKFEIKNSTTLVGGETYNEIVIDATGFVDRPLNVVIPSQGITVKSKAGKDCITVKGGNAQILGGAIYHMNDTGNSSSSIIKVESGATLNLTNISIYGTSREKANEPMNHDEVTPEETVGNGIYNEGTVFMQTNVNITRIHANHDVEADGVFYNKGSITLMDGVFIHDNYSCYAIYPEPGSYCTQTVRGGVIVGVLPEGIKIDGEGKAGIIDGNGIDDKGADATLTIARNGFVQRTVNINLEMFKDRKESLVTPLKNTVTAEKDGKIYVGIYGGNEWHFTDPVKATASYVKMKDAKYASGSLQYSHTITDGKTTPYKDNVGDKFSISTAFIDGEKPNNETEAVYMLCDIIIPKNSSSYVKCANGQATYGDNGEFKVTNQPPLNDEDGYISSITNSNEYTLKIKYVIAAGSQGDDSGVIVDGLYSPKAIAYIRSCTKEQYDSAVEYKEAEAYSEDMASASID